MDVTFFRCSLTEAAALRAYVDGADVRARLLAYEDFLGGASSLMTGDVYAELNSSRSIVRIPTTAAPGRDVIVETSTWPLSYSASAGVILDNKTVVWVHAANQTLSILRAGSLLALVAVPAGTIVVGAWNLLRVKRTKSDISVYLNPRVGGLGPRIVINNPCPGGLFDLALSVSGGGARFDYASASLVNYEQLR